MLEAIGLLRIIKTGFVNFWRNIWLSAAATMVMTITLVIFSVLFLLFALTSYSISTVQNTVDISVYFKTGLSEDHIMAVKTGLEADPKVKEVGYVSSREALENFKLRHQNDSLIAQSLNELTENPLPATLHVKAHNLEDYPALSEQLKDEKFKGVIDKVNFEDNRVVIERLGRILNFIITFGLGLIAVFVVIAILVIFNTITLTIYNRREEVEIMRLVGATNWYIRGPFLVEAILYSVFATMATALLFFPVFSRVVPKIALFVNPQVTLLSRNVFSLWYLSAILIIISLVLAVSTTFMAIRKYLKI